MNSSSIATHRLGQASRAMTNIPASQPTSKQAVELTHIKPHCKQVLLCTVATLDILNNIYILYIY